MYLPSISSLEGNLGFEAYLGESRLERTGNAQNETSDITPYTWIGDTGSIEVYNYNSTIEGNWETAPSISAYYNLRFFNKPLSWSITNKLRIFKASSSALANTSLYNAIGGQNAIQPNDIVVLENDAAYIYIASNEYNNYSTMIEPQGTANSLFNTQGRGGWLKSTAYMTRSVCAGSSTNSNFIYINARGETIQPAESSTQPGNLSLTYAFTI